jgi:hypothetical protein
MASLCIKFANQLYLVLEIFLSALVLFLKTHFIGIAFLPEGEQQGSQVWISSREETLD